jgi:hypothetical protein
MAGPFFIVEHPFRTNTSETGPLLETCEYLDRLAYGLAAQETTELLDQVAHIKGASIAS